MGPAPVTAMLFRHRSGVLLGPAAARESYLEDVMASVEIRPDDTLLLEFNDRLRALDPGLLMVRAATTVVPGVPMRPGYYHLLHLNAMGAPANVTVIEGDDGEFVEPTSRVFERLAAGDMRERRNLERFATNQRSEYAANERDQERNHEERREHLRELVNAYTRASVPGTGAGLWTQNQAGRRDAGERRKKRGRK